MCIKNRKLISRRDFIAAGMLPFAAQILAPNWLKILATPPEAMAASGTCVAGDGRLVPFITMDLPGGAALDGNFAPFADENQTTELTSYSTLGGGTSIARTKMFSNGVQIPTRSTFFAAIRNTVPADVLAKTAMIGVCIKSQSDTSDNKLDISGLLTKSGLAGSLMPNLGTRNSLTGGNNKSAVVAAPAPLVVNSFNSLTNSIGYTASLKSKLSTGQQSSLSKLITNLSDSQSRKLASAPAGDGIKQVLDCAGIKNNDLIGKTPPGLDPGDNASFASIWNITKGQGLTSRDYIFSSMVFNTLNKQAGTSAIVAPGGFDYHDQTRTTGDGQDAVAGNLISQMLRSASVMNSPIYIYVTTDGSVASTSSATEGGGVWTGDTGTTRGMAYVFYFNPTAAPKTQGGAQLGSYQNSQDVSDANLVGSNMEVGAAAVFANYLSVSGVGMDIFQQTAGRIISVTDLDKVLRLA